MDPSKSHINNKIRTFQIDASLRYDVTPNVLICNVLHDVLRLGVLHLCLVKATTLSFWFPQKYLEKIRLVSTTYIANIYTFQTLFMASKKYTR